MVYQAFIPRPQHVIPAPLQTDQGSDKAYGNKQVGTLHS